MPNQHKTRSVCWHPSDPTLRPWLETEAERQGITLKDLLDAALDRFRSGSSPASPSPSDTKASER